VGRALAAIPELDTLEGDGEVPEALAGRLRVGQKARLSLDALPGVELAGTVRRIAPSPSRRAWDDPATVVHLRIALDAVDVDRMRPGMRFRGKVVVETLPDVLQVPLAAVSEGEDGPEVTVRRGLGWRTVRVRTGRTAGARVELLQGPPAGARVRLEAGP
jgi:HlyD family secretion protein